MSATGFVFDSDQLEAAGRQFVEQGPVATRDLRQAEVDGAKNFLLSDAARKLRIDRPEPPKREPARTVLGIDEELRAERG